MTILIFGDSIAQGFYDSGGGWAGRIAAHYHNQTLRRILKKDLRYSEVFNLGLSGEGTVCLLERLKNEVRARTSDKKSTTIVLATGINDSLLRKNRALHDVYEFETNYAELIKEAKRLAVNVICVGLTAVDESLSNPWIGSATGKQLLNNRINLFEDAIKQLAVRNNVPFVAVHDEFLGLLDSGEVLLADGLHPNDKGHQMIYELVKAELLKLCP